VRRIDAALDGFLALWSAVVRHRFGSGAPMEQEDTIRDRLIARINLLEHEKLLALEEFLARWQSSESEPIQSGVPAPHSNIQSGVPAPHSKDWPHAPVHRISEHGTYIVTAGTLHKEHFFRGEARLGLLQGELFALAKQHGWHLEAWAVFSNHYHFVGQSQPDSMPFNKFLADLHSSTATTLNRIDGKVGRQVWHNFWETRLTYERSYLARLNYVHQNPVRHGLVPVPRQYRWCSAAWFERTATPAQVKTIYSFKIDKLKVFDEFDLL
jgi:putative transposase